MCKSESESDEGDSAVGGDWDGDVDDDDDDESEITIRFRGFCRGSGFRLPVVGEVPNPAGRRTPTSFSSFVSFGLRRDDG